MLHLERPMGSPRRCVEKTRQRKEVYTGLYTVFDKPASPATSSAAEGRTQMISSRQNSSLALSADKPLHCSGSRLRIRMTEKTVVYRLSTTYLVENTLESKLALFFPVSRCVGAVSSLLIRINKKIVMWELVRMENGGSWIRLLDSTSTTHASDVDKADVGCQRSSVEVYSIVSNVPGLLESKMKARNEIPVEIQWTTKEMTWCGPHMLQIAYAFACAPRIPDDVVCRAVFSTSVVMVQSSNCCVGGPALEWRNSGRHCGVRVTSLSTALALYSKDDVFVLKFYFQNHLGVDHQCGSFGPIFLVIVLGVILWCLFTKDLEQ